jgi:integrase
MSGKRRRFGRVRRLPSGRFQVRYSLGDGSMRRAPSTFATQAEAEQFLAMVEVDLNRGTWFDPEAGDIRLDVYAPRWLVERPVELQPRTVEIYTRLLNLYLYPAFGATPLNRITSAAVRTWHASLRQRGVGQVSTAKAYRLLKAILNTAVEDELIPRNPCRLKAAGVERSPERRPPSLPEVELIADCVEPRYRLLVLLGAWSGLRWGELAALTRQRSNGCMASCTSSRRWCKPTAATATLVRRSPPRAGVRSRCHRTCGRRSTRTSPRTSALSRRRCCSPRPRVRRWIGRTFTPGGDARPAPPESRTTGSTTCVILRRRWPRSAAQRPAS